MCLDQQLLLCARKETQNDYLIYVWLTQEHGVPACSGMWLCIKRDGPCRKNDDEVMEMRYSKVNSLPSATDDCYMHDWCNANSLSSVHWRLHLQKLLFTWLFVKYVGLRCRNYNIPLAKTDRDAEMRWTEMRLPCLEGKTYEKHGSCLDHQFLLVDNSFFQKMEHLNLFQKFSQQTRFFRARDIAFRWRLLIKNQIYARFPSRSNFCDCEFTP